MSLIYILLSVQFLLILIMCSVLFVCARLLGRAVVRLNRAEETIEKHRIRINRRTVECSQLDTKIQELVNR
ncbi:hypothetical protein W822_20095 [Advenella kashmirensis W13003]|uniref:Uncharacterized protein n=1 Tax=Advenella kashmirensis W13003 TaxID=1424334 RepID=V8QNQ0_9BURK|nr:hypothetical protein W822_20095 [Advenella kashmirensis W13003]